ncbi:MAG TPA: DUF364 domain-containing protein [Anaerolineaceae bacterium]|nr:DUF364 domain-containing protein [Anaerolineaceae bacterium]
MTIISDLLSTLPRDPIPVQNVVIGVHWTLVTSRFSGLGSTLVNSGPHGSGRMRDVGDLLNKNAQELAGWLESDNLLAASVGMAALNSIIEVPEKQLQPVNAAEVIEREARGKNLAVIGHFPFLERLKGVVRNLWVMEQNPYGDDLPEEAAQEYVPGADVVAITGTAFINHTIENLLPLCRQDALVMILGPSTPLHPMLFDRGISYLSGSRVVDPSAAQLTIQQGAGFPQVKGVQVVTMVKQIQS